MDFLFLFPILHVRPLKITYSEVGLLSLLRFSPSYNVATLGGEGWKCSACLDSPAVHDKVDRETGTYNISRWNSQRGASSRKCEEYIGLPCHKYDWGSCKTTTLNIY